MMGAVSGNTADSRGVRLAAALTLLAAMLAPAQPQLPWLTNAHEVHALTPEQANLHYPVRLRGVVTFYSTRMGELFVQDETGGMYVEIYHDKALFPMGFSVKRGHTGTPGPLGSPRLAKFAQ